MRSIRWRLAASYALLIMLSITLMAALILYIVQGYVGKQESNYLRANAQQIADLAQRFLEPQVRRTAIEELAFTSAFLGDARVRIMDGDHDVLADSGDPGLPDDFVWLVPSRLSEIQDEGGRSSSSLPMIIPLPSQQQRGQISPRDLLPLLRSLPYGTSFVFARRMPTPWGRRFVFETGQQQPPQPDEPVVRHRQVLSVTLSIGDADSPMGWVEMSSPLSLSDEVLRPVRSAILISGLGALVVAVLMGLLFGARLSTPLQSLAATAKRMGAGDLAARAASGGKDEIGELARQFNGMAESLERSFHDLRAERDSLKRFVADASHELRTPITALATFNELLQGSAAEDPGARQEFLRESQTQLAKLQWITANLLDLSRLEAGIAGLSLGLRSAADIIDVAAAASRPRAREKAIALALDTSTAGFTVSCDSQRMEMALANLIANAVKFTQEGGAVTVSASSENGRARFVVRDNGPGIAAEDLPLIFDRFYRGRNAKAEGAGLGLAIVQSVAHAHGGEVRAQSSPGAGSLFTIEIPLGEGAGSPSPSTERDS